MACRYLVSPRLAACAARPVPVRPAWISPPLICCSMRWGEKNDKTRRAKHGIIAPAHHESCSRVGSRSAAFMRVKSALSAYPERPVKIVVPNSPGGPSDIVGRIIAAALQQSTGKTFVIENRSGGGANIGVDYAAHSQADGYTLVLVTSGYSVNVGLFRKLSFDPYNDFVGVSELATSPDTFVVKSELPAKTMKEFVALVRANPEKFNVSTPPIGSPLWIQTQVL